MLSRLGSQINHARHPPGSSELKVVFRSRTVVPYYNNAKGSSKISDVTGTSAVTIAVFHKH